MRSLLPIKIYRAILFVAAGLLFLASLAQLNLPDWYYLLVKIVATATAFYSAYYIRRSSLLDACGLFFMALILITVMPNEAPEVAVRMWLLVVAVSFIRLGVSLNYSPEVKQEKA